MNAPVPMMAVSVPSLAMNEVELISVLESSLYPGAKPESIKLVIAYCRAAQLDPMLKPVHIVPMKVKQKKRDGGGFEYVWRDVVMPGIELYRIRAARTGEYVGMDPAKWGDDKTEKLGEVTVTYAEWCEVTVYRLVDGTPRPFPSGRVYWKEAYATKGYDDEGNKSAAPNAMWTKRPKGQHEKCAEALALRRAFPELGAQPTAEEMEGRVIDATEVPAALTAPQIPGPEARQAPEAGKPEPFKPMNDSQKRMLRAKLKNTGLTEEALAAKFGKSLNDTDEKGFGFGEFQAVQTWIASGGKG